MAGAMINGTWLEYEKPAPSSGSAATTLQDGNGWSDWWSNESHAAHNEAIYDWQRSQASAADARAYQAAREDTAFSRKVQDVVGAGFSPLAAMDSNGFAVGSVPTAESSAASSNGSNMGNLITGLVAALAMVATKGISAAASGASAAKTVAMLGKFGKYATRYNKLFKF